MSLSLFTCKTYHMELYNYIYCLSSSTECLILLINLPTLHFDLLIVVNGNKKQVNREPCREQKKSKATTNKLKLMAEQNRNWSCQ